MLSARSFAQATADELQAEAAVIDETGTTRLLQNPVSWFLPVPTYIQAHIVIKNSASSPVYEARFKDWGVVEVGIPALYEPDDRGYLYRAFVLGDCQESKIVKIDKKAYTNMYAGRSSNGKSGVYNILGDSLPDKWELITPDQLSSFAQYFPLTHWAGLAEADRKWFRPIFRRMCNKEPK